jgi:hypothetical protein
MSDVKVSDILWDALSDTEKLIITSHLREYGVLKEGEKIISDAGSPPPYLFQQEAPVTTKAWLIDWICKSICQASGAEENCIHKGKDLRECLTSIRMSREAHGPLNSPSSQISIGFKSDITKH